MDGNDRSKRVLAALVRQYIASGEPVASSLLRQRPGSACRRRPCATSSRGSKTRASSSSRTPRRAACRPTAATASTSICCSNRSARAARPSRSKRGCAATARASTSTRCCRRSRTCCRRRRASVGFAIRPAHEAAVFDRVEFVPLSSARVLVVIVARGGHVIQKVIDIGESLDADDLRQAANYLNAEFSGMPLHRAREAVLERINEERLLYDALMARAMRLATSTFADLPDDPDDLRRRRGVAPRRDAGADARDAAGAPADDRGEAEARAPAERIHRRPGAHRRHRRASIWIRTCGRSA